MVLPRQRGDPATWRSRKCRGRSDMTRRTGPGPSLLLPTPAGMVAARGSPARAVRGSPARAVRGSPAPAVRGSPARAVRGSPARAVAAALLLLTASVDTARVNKITPRTVGFAGGEITILGSDFAEDQYSQFQPELGNIVNFVNDWDTIPCKVNVYKSSTTRIICTVGPLRTDRGLGNWYAVHLTVDGLRVHSGWSIQFHDNYTPYVDSVEPPAGPPGSLITLRGRFYTDQYSIDTKTAGELQASDVSIAWIRVGSKDCDPVNTTSGEMYGLFSDVIICRTADTYAGPLSVQLMVTNRGLSAIRNNQRLVSSQDHIYDFLAVPQVTEVRPTSLATGGGAVVTVDGVGFDPAPGATAVTIGGGACRVLTATSTRLTCAAPAEQDTTAQTYGGSGVRYEVWLDAEVSDLGDLSSLTSDSAGYHSEVLLGAAVTNNTFGQAAAAGDRLAGRLSGWLRSPRLGQFVLTLKSDGAAQLRLGSAPDSLPEEPAVESSGGFSSIQKSAMINMTDGQMVYFEATHREGSAAGGYRLQVGLIDYNSPVTRDESSVAATDTQTLYIKGDLRLEQQVLSFENVPAQALGAVQLEFNGIISQTPVDASSATEDTWRSAVEDLFSAQCQYSSVDQAWMRTFEEDRPETGRETGTRKNETIEPWCGSWIMNKPWGGLWTATAGAEIQLARHRWLCLAHWGKIVGHVRVLVEYYSENNQRVRRWKQFDAELPSSQSWTYSCVDLIDKLQEQQVNPPAKLLEVRIPFNYADDVYFDDVSFSAEEKTLSSRRPAARHGAEPLFVRHVQVALTADPLAVAVTLRVAGCASQLPLIRLAGSNGTVVTDTSRLDQLRMTADGWGQGIVTNTRNVSASPAPAGSWDLMFEGQTVQGVPTNLTSEGMTLLLSTRLSRPGLVAHRWGECDKYHWSVMFRHHGGRHPKFAANDSNVQFDGYNLNVGVWKDPNTGDGRVTHAVLPADLTRLPRSAAGRQVKVTVSGVTSQCATDCDVTYDAGENAEVSSVSSETDAVSGDTTVTVTGSNLGSTPEGVQVTLSDAVTRRSCAVTAVTGSEVTCTVPNLQAGLYAVNVTVTDAGQASGVGAVSVAPRLVSVSPAEVGQRGGTVITLRGQRMPLSEAGWLGATVTAGGADCDVINTTSTAASCRLQGDVGAAGSAVDVTVTFGDRSVTLEGAVTTLATIARITALNVSSASAAGGEILGITGAGFGRILADQSVTVGGASCDVTQWADTEISCRLPPLGHGDHTVEVNRGQLGLADNSAVSALSTVFKVRDVSPRLVSAMGGSVVRVRGEGLAAACDRLNITAGQLYTCQPVTCTDTSVTCRLRRRRRRHVIRNNVTHPRYGAGFLWAPQQLTVAPGDLVSWRWAPAQVSSGSVGFAVHRTAGQDADEYDQTGFNSGDKTQTGSFTTMIEDIGTTFYSGPPAGATVPRMRGVINVEAPPVGESMLSVRIGSVEAIHDPATAAAPPFEPAELCAADTPPASCPGTEDPLLLRSDDCVTPRVTEVTVTQPGQGGTLIADSELIVSGTGFSSTACHNRLMIGSGSCDVTAATANQLTCRVTAAGLPHGAGQPLTLSVANRGEAVIDVAAPLKYFRSEPTVSGVTPTSGSPTGGTLLTIAGSGLVSGSADSPARVTVGAAPCPVQSVTLSELTCLTPARETDDTVPVKLMWQDADGQTRTVANMTFTYDASKTPTLSSVELSSGTQRTLTLSGDKFGTDASNVVIRLIPRTTADRRRRRRRQVDTPASDRSLLGDDDVTAPDSDDVTALSSDDVISLDSDAGGDSEPAVEAARREDAAFWRRFCRGDCDSFGAFVGSGQLRAAGSGPAVAVTAPTSPRSDAGDEQDFIELTPEYVNAFREAALGRRRARRRVHLRRRRSVSSDPAQQLTCGSVTLTDGGATCQLPDCLAGQFDVELLVSDLGAAADAVSVDVTPTVTTPSLPAGSQRGGARIRLDGAGFAEDVSVAVGGAECRLTAATATRLECLTPPGEGAQPLVVTSGGLTADGPEYTYSAASTPVITTVDSEDNSDTSVVTGAGTGLGSDAGAYVTVGGRRCTITALQATEFTCELDSHLPGGQHPVTFHSPEDTGDSAPVDLSVPLEVTSVSPATAGLAGTALTVSGGKFDTVSPVTVTVCDTPCQVTAVTSATVTCLAAPVTAAPTSPCDIIVTMTGGASVASEAAFTYDAALTAAVTSVTPSRGGTAGGTSLTVTGAGFAETGNIVTIDGVPCDVTTEGLTQLVCVTNGHTGPGRFSVMVDVPGVGFAEPGEEAQFQYVDRWSSAFSWGGADPPSDGQSVSITAGQTILLDSSTPVLRLILIDGGELIFDPDAAFLELNAEYIVVVGGGKVQIGTEASPHQGQAAITLHGNVRATELPVYGAKVLAVRNGTLDLHGRPIDITWTYLGSTAAAGDSDITLDRPVSWAAGDEIVIASTGDKLSMGESEKRVISAVSADGLTLTLESPLAFEHISSEQTFAGQTVRMRAEVGLLTRNVKVRGSVNDEFTEQVQACAAGFQPGQFDVQTCFHGRYGAETITDQFGATVMIHAKYQNQHLVTGRLEYVEVTEAGQAFRLGRYPIHYHLNGNVTGSYVRGCAIHRTYNRAVTIHAVDYLLVEHNVAYNNMGHAFFTEDGIEAYNVIQYNLAVFTRTSSSLLNVDVTPASFWVVNPTNIVRHNAAAGGTHFGFWYRTEEHPSGPSFTTSYCPNHAPMGEFYNNSAHSFGRYGLWVFSMDGYFPLSGGEDTCSGEPDVARFGQFLAWRCERGAEVVFGGALRFENFTVVDNEMSGLEMVKVKGPFGHDGPGVQNALVVGSSELAGDECTERGIITPKQYIFNVDGATFVNFDGDCTALGACSQCKPEQGGFHHQFRRIAYENSPNKMRWKWTHESVFHDADGSLSGEEDGVVLPWMDILPPEHCTKGLVGFDTNSQVVTAVCDSSVSVHRMAFNRPQPTSLLYKAVNYTTQHGSTSASWHKKRLTHASGWMALLVGGETHQMEFADRNQLTNISYDAGFYFLKSEDRLAVSHVMLQKPDRFQAGGAPSNGSGPALDFSAGKHGDIHWDNDTYTMSYMVSGQSRSRRAVGPFEDRDKGVTKEVKLVVERCFFEGCLPPPVPTVPTGRPDNVQLWSQATADQWSVPGEMEDVTIPADLWVLTDVPLPPIRRLVIYGVLEIGDGMDNVLNCTHIVVYGKLVAGTADQAFQHQLKILLRGRHRVGSDAAAADIPMPAGSPNIGWKSLATFGGLELYGTPRSVQWTSLAATAAAGVSSLRLASAVDWPVGAEVVITTGSYESRETEVRRVISVSEDGTQLTLNDTLQYDHLATEVALPGGKTKLMAAKVGLLTRNIRIEGDSYDDVIEESFGARVLASSYYDSSNVKKTASVRLSNVEFRLAGQDGWSDSYDPRYALALHSLGDTDATIVNCSFNHLFSPAIGIFYSNNVTVRGSVVMHTVGSGIIDEGSRNRLENNLVSWLVFPGTYNNRDEPENLSWDAAFRLNKAQELTLIGNVVAGSERLGFHIGGTDCSGSSSWTDNEVHGALHGVHMFGNIKHEQCAKVSGFFIWRAWDFGIYFHVPSSSVVIDDNVLVENTMSILPMLYEPSPVAHLYEDKRITISNTVVVAVAAADHCAADTAPAIAAFRAQVRAPRTATGGRTGIVWGQFISRKVGAPKKTWHKPMSYPAVRGNTYLSGVHLINFNRLCSGQRDIAISTLREGDDAQHPLISDTISFTDVNSDDKLFLHKPLLSKVNPSDCVDMDCDGQKHALLIDTDGSIIGSVGTAVPQAEYEFDGDQRHGVGYYRVPESAVTQLDGSRIPYADKMPNKGVWRGSGCTWQEPWRAYTCPGGQQRMLVIESMDADTEVRRVSPIALIANPGSSGFVDLLNGPQDVGWCFGYTCQERLSTFYSLVAPGRVYEMHFSGTPPQHLRFHFLNAEPDMTIVLKIWYPKSQRYDVYYEEEFVYPTNVEPETFNFIQSEDPEEFVPKVSSSKHGENYFSRSEGFLHVVIRGPGVVEIKQQPVIVLKMGFVSEGDFFETDVLNRLADLLDISSSQLRVANIVREDSGTSSRRRRRRRRRETATTQMELEVGAAPATDASSNDTASMSIEKLQETQAKVVDGFQTGEMDQALDLKVDAIAMVNPEPPATDPTGGLRATNETGGEDLSGVEGAKTFSEQQQELEQEKAEEEAAGAVTYERPSELVLDSAPVSGSVQELTRLSPLIKLYMNDAKGERMSAVGHVSSPWQVEAQLVSPPAGVSLLQERATFEGGVATFSRLMVSGVADGLRLRFRVVQPSDADFAVEMPGSFETLKKRLEVRVAGNPGEAWHQPGEKISPGVRVEIRDPVTGGLATAAALRGQTWVFQAALYKHADGTPSAALQGTRRMELAPPSGESTYDPAVVFDNLKITPAGWSYLIEFTVTTADDPSVRLATLAGPFQVQSVSRSSLPVIHTLGLKIKADFATVSGRKQQFAAEAVQFMNGRYGSHFTVASVSEGRISLTTRDGTEEAHRQTAERLRRDLHNGLTMTAADGNSYPLGGPLLVDGVGHREKNWSMPPWTLALICIMATLLFVGMLVLIWICCCNTVQRGKVQDVNHMAFKVPINSVPPPPFAPGPVNSFNIRMAITDPNNKVAPSVIQVISDDPLANMEDVKLADFSAPASPLTGRPPVSAPDSDPLSDPAPTADPDLDTLDLSSDGEAAEAEAAAPEGEEQRLQREAKQAQDKAEKEAEQTRQAAKAEAEAAKEADSIDDLFGEA